VGGIGPDGNNRDGRKVAAPIEIIGVIRNINCHGKRRLAMTSVVKIATPRNTGLAMTKNKRHPSPQSSPPRVEEVKQSMRRNEEMSGD